MPTPGDCYLRLMRTESDSDSPTCWQTELLSLDGGVVEFADEIAILRTVMSEIH